MSEKRVDRFLFKLNELLGEGSYGKVYKGRDEKTNQMVAIKMLSKGVINADEYLREGLMSEIKVMSLLKSENIVQLLDVLETSNNYYIVQEFCDGGDFQHHLKKKQKLTQNEAVQFFVDILMGFMVLVKKGIIHRDLKPANILINKGVYKLADFGFAKAIDNFQRDMLTSAVGTPLYMSPQILKNEKYTSKSDVWSMGFIFFEAVYGQTPWTGRSIPELIKNIKTIPLTFPNTNQLAKPYQDMIRSCLQATEADRASWDQVFSHPCFGQAFQFYLDSNKKLEDKALFILNDMKVRIIKEKMDLEQMFLKLDLSGDKSLDIHELSKLLHNIEPNLERDEIEFIFNKIDIDGSNSIEFNEFTKWLEENNVRMSYNSARPGGLQPQPSFDISPVNNQQQQQPAFQSKPSIPVNQPQQQQWGTGSTNQYPQQSTPSQQYPFSPTNQQYPQPNAQYPPNPQYQQPPPMKGSQQFQQQNYPPQQPYVPPQQGYGVPQQQYGYPPNINPQQQYIPWGTQSQQDRSLSTISKLVMAIDKYNINIWELFKKYDKTDSQALDVQEFGIMLRRIDSKLSDQDIFSAFQLFDVDKGGDISFLEFKEGLEFQIKQHHQKLAQQQQPPQYGYPQQYPGSGPVQYPPSQQQWGNNSGNQYPQNQWGK